MSLKAYEWAARVQCPDGVSKAVLLHFASFHNQKTGQCNPSNETMIERSQFDPKTYKAAVKRLEACGLLGWAGSKKGGRAKSIMRVLNAPHSAGVKAYSFQKKGTEFTPPFEVVKGGITQTPFSASEKGTVFPPPIMEEPFPMGDHPFQELKSSGGKS